MVTGLIRWLAPIAVGAIALVACRITLLPGLGFWDTGELQTVAPLLGTAHPTGYPTYVLLGFVANILLSPIGEPAFRMNLFAAICLAVAAAVTVDLVRALTRSTALGVAAAFGMAMTTIVWRLGTQAEAHALHLALVAILLRLLVAWEVASRDRQRGFAYVRPDGSGRRADRLLILAAIVYGLAVGNHSLTLLLAAPIGLFVIAVDPGIVRRPRLVAAATLALVGTVVLVFLELPLRAGPFPAPLVYGRPDTWDGFWYVALAEQFRGSVIAPFSDLAGKGGALVDLAAAQFGPLAILIPAAFVATVVVRPRYALLSGSAVALTCFFAASYVNADIERYYAVPVLLAWTWLAILAAGVARALARLGRGGDSLRHHGPSPVAVGLLGLLLVSPTLADLSPRIAAVDRSADRDAQRWVDQAFSAMAPDAMVVSWWSYSTALWYAQLVAGGRPDIDIIDDRTRLDRNLGDLTHVIDANLPDRPVYVIRADPAEIAALTARYRLAYEPGLGDSLLARVLGRRVIIP
jgi:transmembrane protein TMEM260 (protein O-mannosyltransferase)